MYLELLLTAIRVPLDFVMLLLAGVSAWGLRLSDQIVSTRPVQFALTFPDFIRILIPTALVWLLIFTMNGLYTIGTNKKFSEELKSTIISCFAGLAIITIAVFVRGEKFDSRFIVLAGAFFAIVYVLIGRLIIRIVRVILYKNHIGMRKVVLIGDSAMGVSLFEILSKNPGFGCNILKHIPHLTEQATKSLAQFARAHAVEEVLFINPGADEQEAARVLSFCEEQHLTLKFAPDIFDIYQRSTAIDTIAGIPVIELKRTRLEGWGRILKRLLDIIASSILLLLSLPVLLLTMLIIFFESGRPIFFKNERVGESGKLFNTFKFRSMRQEYSIGHQFKNTSKALQFEQELIKKQNAKSGPVYKIRNDPRVTLFGRFIRRWSIDEIPQFINVLMGDMSLVGPRPHQPREVEKYQHQHKKVHTIKPGITGIAQISGRSDLAFEEENRLDVFYIENWSMLMDVAILIKTPWAVLRRRKVE